MLNLLISASIQMLSKHWKEGRTFRTVFERGDPAVTAFKATKIKPTKSLVAEVCALFYQGRDGDLSEEYEARLQHHGDYPANVSRQTLGPNFQHVFSKLNFAECLCAGLRQIGYPEFALKFRPQIDAIKSGIPQIQEVSF